MISLIGRVLLRTVVHKAVTKVTTTAKNTADSTTQTAAQVSTAAKGAAGAVGHVMSEASTAAISAVDAVADMAPGASALVRSAIDVTGDAASEASKFAKRGVDAVGRAAAGASALKGNAVGAFGDALAEVTATVSSSWSENGEVFLPQRESHSKSALSGIVLFAEVWFVALTILLIIWIHNAYRADNFLGALEAFALTATLFSAAFWLYREGRGWRRLAVVQDLQRDLSVECRTELDEARFRAAMRRLRRVAREASLIEFIDGADLGADTAMLRQELDQIGLCAADANAIEAIRRSTRDVFFLSLLSTNALIDMAAFSIRALGMIRRIAYAYGHRPGRIGNLRLVRHILVDIALLPVIWVLTLETVRGAGSAVRHVSQTATTLGTATMAVPVPGPHHLIGGVALAGGLVGGTVGRMAESVTPRIADAALAAGRIGHLGLLAVAHVRPVSLSRASYGRMRNAVYKQILGLRRDAARQERESRP